MSEYLMRDGAPFGESGWAHVDGKVIDVAKKVLVGRRFVDLIGPLGWGVEVAPVSTLGGDTPVTQGNTYLPLQELSADFILRAKDLAVAEASPFGYETGAVAVAATKLAKAEDALVLGGLMEKAETSDLGDWETMGGPFKAVTAAMAKLREAGFDGPYVAVMHPTMYARLAGLMQHGRRELEMVEKVLGGKLYQTPVMADGQVMLASPQSWNFDMVVGQDIITAYMGNEELDHRFRIFETLVLRVKRAGAVLVLK